MDTPKTRSWTVWGCAIALLLALARADAVQIDTGEQNTPAVTEVRELLRAELARLPEATLRVEATITVGARAFKLALDNLDDARPIIATFLTSTDFQSALDGRARPANVTAIFSNPNPVDQVRLARLLLGAPRIGVIQSPNVAALTATLAPHGVTAIPFSPVQDVDAILRGARQIDAIVALPDSAVLNPSNVGYVVRTLYSRRKVLIGYSDTLTRVGSLASVYVTPEALARSAGEVLSQLANNGSLAAPVFVSDVDVSLNEQLARSLSIAVPTEAMLRDAMRSTGKERVP